MKGLALFQFPLLAFCKPKARKPERSVRHTYCSRYSILRIDTGPAFVPGNMAECVLSCVYILSFCCLAGFVVSFLLQDVLDVGGPSPLCFYPVRKQLQSQRKRASNLVCIFQHVVQEHFRTSHLRCIRFSASYILSRGESGISKPFESGCCFLEFLDQMDALSIPFSLVSFLTFWLGRNKPQDLEKGKRS